MGVRIYSDSAQSEKQGTLVMTRGREREVQSEQRYERGRECVRENREEKRREGSVSVSVAM